MLELSKAHLTAWSVHAAEEACDLVMRVPGACRVAPDEAMVLGEVPGDLREAVLKLDSDAVILDVTDGWAGWILTGEGLDEAFARLSELELPEDGYVQGDVAHVPARVISEPGRLAILVPAMWEDHMRERISHDCARLGLKEASP